MMALPFLLAPILFMLIPDEPQERPYDPCLYQICATDSTPDRWPDDGWREPPMHTPEQMAEIMKDSIHICQISKTGPCLNHPMNDVPYK